jgi:two-component system cell cycle response regulator DivK
MTEKPKIILIVEDNQLNMELVRDLLLAKGYAILEATDADECRRQLEREVPDLILMDLQLPETDGYTLAREIKNREPFNKIPIIALTAYAMRGDREKALASGCEGFISKPIEIQAFLEAIRGYLRQPS